MEYRRLGKSGLKLSALSFGSWTTFALQLDEKAAADCMKLAYEAGVNFFDNAEVYASGASEEIMGNVLRKLDWDRDTYCISSKVFWGGELPTQKGLNRKHVTEACHAALKRLKMDYLDLYFCHRPDVETPIEETVRAMHDLIQQGKVLYWGTSEWSADQIMEAYSIARQYGLTPPSMEQPQYNMLFRDKVEREFHRLYSEIGLGTTIWSPLASGVLTGKYNEGIPENARVSLPDYEWLKNQIFSDQGKRNIEKVKRLQNIADEIGTTLPKMAISWCLKNTNVSTVILGASKLEQLKENLSAFEDISLLTEEIMTKIEKVLQNKPEMPTVF